MKRGIISEKAVPKVQLESVFDRVDLDTCERRVNLVTRSLRLAQHFFADGFPRQSEFSM